MTRSFGLIKRVLVIAFCIVAYVVLNPTQALCQEATGELGEEATAPQKQPTVANTSVDPESFEYNKKKFEDFQRLETKGGALVGVGILLTVTGGLGSLLFGAMYSQIGVGGGFLAISALVGIGGIMMIVSGAAKVSDARYGMDQAKQLRFQPELENITTSALDSRPLARNFGLSMNFSF